MKVTAVPDHDEIIHGFSPVVGVFLMVLITLLIAAILGTFIVT